MLTNEGINTSRARSKKRPLRESLTTGYRNILHSALVDRSNVILPPLHFKLVRVKLFVKALNEEDAGFEYIQEKFPYMKAEKI